MSRALSLHTFVRLKCDGFLFCFQSPCCEKVYKCRLCHDEQENHTLDRYKVAEVQCLKCDTRQSVSQHSNYHNLIVVPEDDFHLLMFTRDAL